MIKDRRSKPVESTGDSLVRCFHSDCDVVVTMVLRPAHRGLIGVCQRHVHELGASTVGPACVVELVDAPYCFHRSCKAKAARVMQHLDGSLIPVCEQHLDDLSWVTPAAFADEPLPGLDGDLG